MTVGFAWWKVRHYWPARLRWKLENDLPWWIAFHLPRKVALMAFVRVYGVLGYVGPDFDIVYDAWEARTSASRATATRATPPRSAPVPIDPRTDRLTR